jgi:hypothetical protein
MDVLRKIRFWQLMVGTGFVLLTIGLILIFLPPGVGDSDPYLIEFFEAKIEGTEMGLALIVLGLSCFLIGRKDLSDLRAVQVVRGDLQKTSTLTAKLVADRVARVYNELPAGLTKLASNPDLDVGLTRRDLLAIQNGDDPDRKTSHTIGQAERGLELLDALEREGYSI